jgi:hypothetical protein
VEGPLSVVLQISHATEMALSVAIGFGFGFVLERAGFGRADRLAAVFYGRDFRVLRVMFSAIVTAMVGLYLLDLAGVLPLASIGILDTYLWPQLVGGLLLGAGFILGGYCPGTSVVAAVSGKVDALLFLGGLVLGATLFTLGYQDLAAFAASGARGRLLLHEAFGLPSGVVVFAVALFAVGAFRAVGRIERAVNARLPARAPCAGEPAAAPAAPAVVEGSAS